MVSLNGRELRGWYAACDCRKERRRSHRDQGLENERITCCLDMNPAINNNISPRLSETRAITIRSIVFLPCALGDYIPGALLGFHVYLTDILA